MGLPGSSSFVYLQCPKVLLVFYFLNLLPYMHGIVIHCVDVREVLSIYPPLQFPSPPCPTASSLPHPSCTCGGLCTGLWRGLCPRPVCLPSECTWNEHVFQKPQIESHFLIPRVSPMGPSAAGLSWTRSNF